MNDIDNSMEKIEEEIIKILKEIRSEIKCNEIYEIFGEYYSIEQIRIALANLLKSEIIYKNEVFRFYLTPTKKIKGGK